MDLAELRQKLLKGVADNNMIDRPMPYEQGLYDGRVEAYEHVLELLKEYDEPAFPEDTNLLKAILAEEIGPIANIVQAASELEGGMSARLAMGYWEITNRDPRVHTDTIQLREDED